MPTDPNIVLAAGDIKGPQPDQLMSMYAFAQQVKQAQQDTAKKNALLQVFSNPNSLDASGNVTPQAQKAVMAADPEFGLKLQDDALENQVRRAQIEHNKTEVGKNNFDFLAKVSGIGYDAYDEAKRAGKSEADAISIGQAARNEAAANNGGVVGDDIVDGIRGGAFDPVRVKAIASTDKDWSTRKQQGVKDDLDAQKLTDTEAKEAAAEKIAAARLDEQAKRDDALIAAQSKKDPTATKWEVLTDPKTQTQYRYNPDTYQSTTLDGKPYTPTGAAKLGATGGNAFTPEESDLMGALAEKGVSLPAGARAKDQQKALYAGILARNPGKTADELADLIKKGQIEFGAQKKETGVAATQAGKVELAQNEIKRFTPLVLEASKAIPRGTFLPINKLMQMGDTQITDPNLKTLKIYVNSMMNAYDQLAARGGTDVAKREEAHSLLTSADSEESFERAVAAFNKEADAAHGAAVDAMKVPELSGDKPKASGKAVDHSKMSDEDLKKKLGIQ